MSSAKIVKAVIEIPFLSHIKYEMDKDTNEIVVDRVLYSSMVYPANYGFIPNTLAKDEDPIDILVLCGYSLIVKSSIKCKAIGVLIMSDEAGIDEKIIAVPTEKIDPTYKNINSIEDIDTHSKNKIKNFFEVYKTLEPNKWVKVKEFAGYKEAEKIINEGILNYKKSR